MPICTNSNFKYFRQVSKDVYAKIIIIIVFVIGEIETTYTSIYRKPENKLRKIQAVKC
jgi:hypothetical protein